LCLECTSGLARLLAPLCPRCGRPEVNGIVCASCRQTAGEIDGVRSVFCFDRAVRQAVYQLKYRNLRAIAPLLAGLLADYVRSNPIPGDVLVPVPLHPSRIRVRGYNQSRLLAAELGRQLGMPLAEDSLVRVGYVGPQVKASDVAERRRNVADAFACRDRELYGKRVILVDDVCTSGATLDSCAAALKKEGVASVWGLTLARETFR